MSSVKWIHGVIIILSLVLGACGGPGLSDPVTTITNPANGSVHPESSNISFTGTGSDDEDGTLSGESLEWSSDTDGQLGTGTTVSSTLSPGSHTITLKATDSDGAIDTDTITIAVNAAPVIDTMTADLTRVNVGTPTTLSWTITDAENNTLTCGLDINGDGTDEHTINDCANGSQAHIYTQTGNYEVRLTVRDGINPAVQQSVNIAVTPEGTINTAPQIDSFNATPNVPKTNNFMTLNWTVSDTDSDTLTCKLDIDADGTNDYTVSDCANNTSQAHTYTQAGNYKVRLAVEDGANAPVLTEIDVTVSSTPPVISEFTVNPDPAYSTVATALYWQVSDPEGDTLTCLLDIDNDGTDDYTINNCANIASQEHTYASSGNYTALLTVRDSVNETQTTLSLTVKSHLLLDVTVDGPVSANGRALYTITVSNVSAVPIDDVSVVYAVPAELRFHPTADAEPDANCGSTCADGAEASWTLGTLVAGESRTITVNAVVLSSLDVPTGTLINALTRVTSPDIIDIVNVTTTVAVNNTPISQLAMSASKDPVIPGDNLVYQFNIGNINTAALTNSELRAVLPAGVTVNNISNGGTLDDTTGEIVWIIASLAADNTTRREVSVTVDTSAIAGQILTSRAELRHDEGIALDGSAGHSVTVAASTFPLMLNISAAHDPVVANQRLPYNIIVSNISAEPVNTVEVQLRVPPQLQFHPSADAEPDTSCESTCADGAEASWALGTLTAGESRTITINTTVLSPSDVPTGTLINSLVRVTSSDVIDNINKPKIVAVHNSPMSQLAMSASKNPVIPGDSLVYQFDISSVNATALSNLELRAILPAGVTVNSISDNGTRDSVTGEIVWTVASLAADDTIQREVSATIDIGTIAGQILAARAELRHNGGIALDSSAEHAVTVVASALSTKWGSPIGVHVPGRETYLEVQDSLPVNWVITGLGFRAHEGVITTMLINAREVTATGLQGNMEKRSGSAPDNPLEVEANCPPGSVVTAVAMREANDNITNLRLRCSRFVAETQRTDYWVFQYVQAVSSMAHSGAVYEIEFSFNNLLPFNDYGKAFLTGFGARDKSDSMENVWGQIRILR
ncbi:MAG: PKD domain-containing protein [Gammaproteobacteria bacterium]|nr:PKD domain-containing protein [Gammaproteobacteria bacterium]